MSKPSKEVAARYKKSAAYAASFKARVARNMGVLAKLKDVECKDCGVKYPKAAMQFDHTDGKKPVSLVKLASTGSSVEAIMKEFSRCEVVCANCHAIRTQARRQGELDGTE